MERNQRRDPALTPNSHAIAPIDLKDARLPAPASLPSLEISPGLVLDARRAAWLPRSKILGVADLHLGYAWIQRSRGQLLPVTPHDDTAQRLLSLVEFYQPQRLVILGDIVHAAHSLPQLRDEFIETFAPIASRCEIVLLPGNHDQHLESWIRTNTLPFPVRLQSDLVIDGFHLLHGDDPGGELAELRAPHAHRLIGHEHPAWVLSDGFASRVRVPCFAAGSRITLLPAFSNWAAGAPLFSQPFLGSLARQAILHHAYVCVGNRLLKIPLPASHPPA